MTTASAPARSYLFVPGDRPERIPKALHSGADAVIVDLEDAVAPDAKAAARQTVASALSPAYPVFVRVNGPETPWFKDDVELCRMPGAAGVVLPKAEQVDHLGYVVDRIGAGARILPFIETAKAMWNAHAIAQSPGVERLLFGALDLQLDLGISGEGEELLYFRSRLVLVSRVAGLAAPVDGVTVALDDPDVLRADALRARRLGFGGKLCIHPKQIAMVNECFRPSEAEIAWARRVLDAVAAAGKGAVALDGQMVDRPVIARAEAIVNAARAPK